MAYRLSSLDWFARLGRRLVPLDLAVQRRTGGRISLLRLAGLPALLLTTTGRRTGRPHQVPLLYVPHPDGYLVAGSNWGQRHHPAWSTNLLATPEAVAEVRGRRIPVRARLLVGAERDAVWPSLVAVWPAYDSYAARSGRDIRVFLLEPRPGSDPDG